MTRQLIYPLIAVAVLFVEPVNAMQSNDITHLSEVTPLFEKGVLSGCSVNFVVSHPVDTIDDKKRIFAGGEIQLRKSRKGPLLILQVVPGSLTENAKAPIAEAYLFNGLKSNVSDFAAASNFEGKKAVAFRAEEATLGAIVDAVIQTGSITVGYALKEGENLTTFKIDLKNKLGPTSESPVPKLDRTAPSRWITCVGDLIEQ